MPITKNRKWIGIAIITTMVAGGSAAALTPREYVAKKIGGVDAKLSKARKAIVTGQKFLNAADKGLETGEEAIIKVAGEMAKTEKQVAAARGDAQKAERNCVAMGERLKGLPSGTPHREDMQRQNAAQCDALRDIGVKLAAVETQFGEGQRRISGFDGKFAAGRKQIAAVAPHLTTARKAVYDAQKVVRAVLNTNDHLMPNVPNIKKLK